MPLQTTSHVLVTGYSLLVTFVLNFRHLVIRICFGFRDSNFGFTIFSLTNCYYFTKQLFTWNKKINREVRQGCAKNAKKIGSVFLALKKNGYLEHIAPILLVTRHFLLTAFCILPSDNHFLFSIKPLNTLTSKQLNH